MPIAGPTQPSTRAQTQTHTDTWSLTLPLSGPLSHSCACLRFCALFAHHFAPLPPLPKTNNAFFLASVQPSATTDSQRNFWGPPIAGGFDCGRVCGRCFHPPFATKDQHSHHDFHKGAHDPKGESAAPIDRVRSWRGQHPRGLSSSSASRFLCRHWVLPVL